ncbi:MAG: hypothetical protein HUU57_14565, partial [Bdellovibrio sp.]|nr:hypothetical protein [Bdellovibrio sp.]
GGLVNWLTGAMGDIEIQLPEKFDLKGVLSFILQVLGLSWNVIRQKLVKRLGAKVVGFVEKSVDIVTRIIKEGPIALWNMIKEKAAEIKQQVMEGIRNWVITQLVKQAIIKLLSFLNPAGAIVQAILAIYNMIMFFVENWQRIVEFVKTVFNSITDIAMGKLSAAAAAVERAMGMTIPIILNFLSRLIGLSGIGKTVKNIIQKIRRPIDKVVDKVIGFVAKKAKKLLGKFKRKKVKAKIAERVVTKRINMKGKAHTLKIISGTGSKVLMNGTDLLTQVSRVKSEWDRKKPKNNAIIKALGNIESKAKSVKSKASKPKKNFERGPEINALERSITSYANRFNQQDITSENKMRERIKGLKVTFQMNKKSHSLTIEERAGKLELMMSSSATGILFNKILRAEKEITQLKEQGIKQSKGGGTWESILSSLEQRKKEVQILSDWIFQLEAGKEGFTWEKFNSRVRELTQKLESLGQKHKISALINIWEGEHASQYVVADKLDLSHKIFKGKGKQGIRMALYPSTSVLYASYRDSLINTVFGNGKGLEDPQDRKRFLSEAKYNEEQRWHPVLRLINGTKHASVPKPGGIDHYPIAVVRHWNEHGGNNMTQAQRAKWFKAPTNLRMISQELNSSLGAKEPAYKIEVEKNFRGPSE